MQSTSVNTQDKYPSKPITLIVQYSAGGSADFLARSMERRQKNIWGSL